MKKLLMFAYVFCSPLLAMQQGWIKKSELDEDATRSAKSFPREHDLALIKQMFAKLSLEYKPTIVIDPGHGGKFVSQSSAHDKFREKDMVLDISLRIERLLKEKNIKVVLTRNQDKHFDEELITDLMKRVQIAKEQQDPIFVSIHLNWA